MRISKSLVVALCSFSVSAFASILSLKIYEGWEQVLKLWDSQVNPLLILWHPHMPRYLAVYPGFLIEEKFPEIGFSLYISIFIALNFILLRKIALLAMNRQPSILIYLCFYLIHLAMNGRGVIAWTSWLMCIWVCHNISMNIRTPSSQIGWGTISCSLAAVSTGVFVVVLIAFTFVIFSNLNLTSRTGIVHRSLVALIGVPIGYFAIEYFILAVEKNIDYYGGGIAGAFNMLEHGLGVFFFNVGLLHIIIFWLLACACLIAAYILIRKRRFSLIDRLMLLSIIGGFFGFTVLTLSLPLILLRIQSMRLPFSVRVSHSGSNTSINKGKEILASPQKSTIVSSKQFKGAV